MAAARARRHTKIIATLGPSTERAEVLRELIVDGVDVIRLNMAHANAEWVHEVMHRIRTESHAVGRHVSVMMDVKGPEIRTGAVAMARGHDKLTSNPPLVAAEAPTAADDHHSQASAAAMSV